MGDEFGVRLIEWSVGREGGRVVGMVKREEYLETRFCN